MEGKKQYIKVCPKCGGTNTKIPPAGEVIWSSLPDYCSDCQNRGIFPEIEKEHLKDFQKKLKK